MFLLNSRLGHFSAAGLLRHPFSRSYGVILPSSLTATHSSALVYSTHLPVSVYGTVTSDIQTAFLGSVLLPMMIAINIMGIRSCVPVIKSFGGSGILYLIPIGLRRLASP